MQHMNAYKRFEKTGDFEAKIHVIEMSTIRCSFMHIYA